MPSFEIEKCWSKRRNRWSRKYAIPATHHRYKLKLQKFMSYYQEEAVGKGHA